MFHTTLSIMGLEQSMTLTLSQALNAVLTILLMGLCYFLKRFADSVYAIESKINDHGERIANIEGHLGVIPRRRKTDRNGGST